MRTRARSVRHEAAHTPTPPAAAAAGAAPPQPASQPVELLVENFSRERGPPACIPEEELFFWMMKEAKMCESTM